MAIARWVASASVAAGRDIPWASGPRIPASTMSCCPASTISPFSACTCAKAPSSLHRLKTFNNSSSYIRKTRLYAMKNLSGRRRKKKKKRNRTGKINIREWKAWHLLSDEVIKDPLRFWFWIARLTRSDAIIVGDGFHFFQHFITVVSDR